MYNLQHKPLSRPLSEQGLQQLLEVCGFASGRSSLEPLQSASPQAYIAVWMAGDDIIPLLWPQMLPGAPYPCAAAQLLEVLSRLGNNRELGQAGSSVTLGCDRPCPSGRFAGLPSLGPTAAVCEGPDFRSYLRIREWQAIRVSASETGQNKALNYQRENSPRRNTQAGGNALLKRCLASFRRFCSGGGLTCCLKTNLRPREKGMLQKPAQPGFQNALAELQVTPLMMRTLWQARLEFLAFSTELD